MTFFLLSFCVGVPLFLQICSCSLAFSRVLLYLLPVHSDGPSMVHKLKRKKPTSQSRRSQLSHLLEYENHTLSSCCSVAQSCPTLCDPMDRSTHGFLVLHQMTSPINSWVATLYIFGWRFRFLPKQHLPPWLLFSKFLEVQGLKIFPTVSLTGCHHSGELISRWHLPRLREGRRAVERRRELACGTWGRRFHSHRETERTRQGWGVHSSSARSQVLYIFLEGGSGLC